MTAAEAVCAACAIIDERRAKRPLVVGIDGLGGAGKSTLANGIHDAFAGRVSILQCDDFYRPLVGEEFSRLTSEEAYENYFDWRRLRDEALMPLREGKRARYQRHDWGTDRLTEWNEIEPREIVLIEGVFSTRPELRELVDVAIFIETPREERIRRMSARAQPSTSWMDQWMAAEDWYLTHVAPDRHADLVLEGF
jgi:uridine kinase